MIICVVGPTASGKTFIGQKIAEKLKGHIICGDAFQIYKGMDIGTAKESIEERAKVPHALFDIVEPSFDYSVMNYQNDVRRVMKEILNKRELPIIVGGTGLYIKAALYDYEFFVEKESNSTIFDDYSNQELYDYLTKIDPSSALKIHRNNRKRVLRAILIYENSGDTKSDIEAKQKHKLIYENVLFLGVDISREELYLRVDERVEKMFSNGLIDEVKFLINKYGSNCRAFQAIGYKEVISYLQNKINLVDCKELIKKKTRNYVKRQITFFKHQLPLIWFKNKDELIEYALKEGKKNGY